MIETIVKPRLEEKDEMQEMMTYVLLKTIGELQKARNENITKVLLLAKQKGVSLPGINFHYTPRGPCSSEVQSSLGLSLLNEDIEQLSPASLTDTGRLHLSELERVIHRDDQTKILACISDLQWKSPSSPDVASS